MNIKQTPHRYRRSEVNFWIGLPALILIISFIIMAISCRPQRGCYGTRGMSGYGWIKCNETGKACVLAPDWIIVDIYRLDGFMLSHPSVNIYKTEAKTT